MSLKSITYIFCFHQKGKVLIFNFSTLPYDYQIQMAWTASLVLVALVTVTNIAAQLAFSRRGR